MRKIKFSLSKQLILITLTCLLLMIVLISIVIPKSLEPYFENTVYSNLEKPLEIMGKNRDLEYEYKNTVYIQNINGEYYTNENYKEILGIDDITTVVVTSTLLMMHKKVKELAKDHTTNKQ